jgi:predicted nucleic acid-binding protein
MRALLDINVELDVVIDRRPFVNDSKAVLDRHDAGKFQGALAATTLPIVFYVVRKQKNLQEARNAVQVLLQRFEICPVTDSVLSSAFQKSIPDFEDAVQDQAAAHAGIAVIVTRDPAGFAGSSLRIVEPAQWSQELDQATSTGSPP